MKICYLVLVYNELEFTKKTFISIKKQKTDSFFLDIICVDNASDDNIALELKSFCNANEIIYLRHDVNDGYAGGNNFGWNYAKKHDYEYVFIANNDIELLNEGITEKIIQTMKADNNIFLLGTNLIDANNRKIRYSRYHDFIVKHEKINLSENKVILPVSSVIGCFFCVRTKSIKTETLFDKSYFMYSEEQNLEYQLMKSGGVVAVLKDDLYTVKHYGGFFDFEQMSDWKIYLSVRNWVLTTRNFSKKSALLYLCIYFCFILNNYLRYKRKVVFNAFFSGIKLKKLDDAVSTYADTLNKMKNL